MPTPIDDKTDDAAEVEVWDGSLDMLKKAANFAATRIRYGTRSPTEIKDLAFSECCMIVAANPQATFFDLVDGAHRAVAHELRQITSSHGVHRTETQTGARFAAFWYGAHTHRDDYGLDRIALTQVWGDLSEKDRRFLLIRASHKSNVEAAEAMGLNPGTMTRRSRNARKAALRLWFDWETPPPYKQNRQRLRTHCNHGHSLDEHQQWITDTKGNRVRRCGECNRQRSAAHKAKKRAVA